MAPSTTLVFAHSSHRRRWWGGGRRGRRWRGGGGTGAWAAISFWQVVGDGYFSPKSVGQREDFWKIGLPEQPSESPGCASRLAIPGASRDGRAGRCGVGQDRPGQQRQLREALAGLLLVHELASRTQHLLGGQRELLNRPAVTVQLAQHRG